MTEHTASGPDDLTGKADERIAQLRLMDQQVLTAEWLRRQLELVLLEWADDETKLDIERDSRADF